MAALGIDNYFICPTCHYNYLTFEGGEMYICESCHNRFEEDELK